MVTLTYKLCVCPCFFWSQQFQNGYSGSTVNGLLLPVNRRTLLCWLGLFSNRVWLHGPLCLCDVVKELQADLRGTWEDLGWDWLMCCSSVAGTVVWLI